MPRAQSHKRWLRAKQAFGNEPLAIDSRVLSHIHGTLISGSSRDLKEILRYGRRDEIPKTYTVVNGVAVIPVNGVLRDAVDWMVEFYGCGCYEILERELQAAMQNADVKSIVLAYDTPGGQALGVKRCADRIASVRGTKPIVAYVQGMCGSAGYYLASACDRIVSTADSVIGSIGAIYPHMEMAGMLKEYGIGVTVITNKESPKKGHGNAYEKLSDDAKDTLQYFVDTFGRQFIEDVARYRDVTTENVVEKYGKGDAFMANEALKRGLIDGIVSDFSAVISELSGQASSSSPTRGRDEDRDDDADHSLVPETDNRSRDVKKVKALLYAMGLIESLEVTDELCSAVLRGYFEARGRAVPTEETEILAALRVRQEPVSNATVTQEAVSNTAAPLNVQLAHAREQHEARTSDTSATVSDLQASAQLYNQQAGREAVTAAMILDCAAHHMSLREAMHVWNRQTAAAEPPVASPRVNVIREGSDAYAEDVTMALLYRSTIGARRRGKPVASSNVRSPELTDSARRLLNRPLWAVALECLQQAGRRDVDQYSDREWLCEQAMQMGTSHRHTFYSTNETHQFVQASTGPYARPGDFPNILSNLANKFLDSIELDEWTYAEWSAVWPTGFGDFKPTPLINHGTPDELDEVLDAQNFNELTKQEEVLSYIFCRRFGNKWGWTPVLLANDDLGAFAEGMLGLDEAWETTQHRQCLSLLMGNPALLDGSALFANRTNGNNDVASGAAPSDAQWAAMENQYADIKGVGTTTRRVRGALDTILVPTGTQHQEARRTFAPLNQGGIENKDAATTATVGLYRGIVNIIPEPELRDDSVATRFYGFRNPTSLRTATIIRGYFNGYGSGGRRERWFDPDNKTTWISIEGRVGVAIKNWRYAIRNKGAA